jgi:hypothetical protein
MWQGDVDSVVVAVCDKVASVAAEAAAVVVSASTAGVRESQGVLINRLERVSGCVSSGRHTSCFEIEVGVGVGVGVEIDVTSSVERATITPCTTTTTAAAAAAAAVQPEGKKQQHDGESVEVAYKTLLVELQPSAELVSTFCCCIVVACCDIMSSAHSLFV